MPPGKPLIPVTEMLLYLEFGSSFGTGVPGDRILAAVFFSQYEQHLTFAPDFRC